MKGGWSYRKRLKVKTASSNGWGIKINQVLGGRTEVRCVCFKHHCKNILFRDCLSDTAQDSAGKAIAGTGEFTLFSTIWSCSDLLADKWIMQVGIKP